MSREKVEIVRAVFERRREGDFKSHFDLFDPHVVLVLRPEFPDAGAHFGIEGGTHLTMEAEEIVDAPATRSS